MSTVIQFLTYFSLAGIAFGVFGILCSPGRSTYWKEYHQQKTCLIILSISLVAFLFFFFLNLILYGQAAL